MKGKQNTTISQYLGCLLISTRMKNANTLLFEIKKAVKEGRVRITDHADEEMAKLWC